MKHKVIGLHSDNAIKIVLKLFDGKKTEKEKIKLLLDSRPVANLNSINTPNIFASGKTIDINAGELLGLGCVVAYYDWMSEQSQTNNTYQAIVGIEDSKKPEVEKLLSDGAIWQNQTKKKMVIQQVMAQGYYPVKTISNEDVIEAVNLKLKVRSKYPKHCALIVNIFAEMTIIDRKIIYDEISKLKNTYTDIFIVNYNLPKLTMANINFISRIDARGLNLELSRNDFEDEWFFDETLS